MSGEIKSNNATFMKIVNAYLKVMVLNKHGLISIFFMKFKFRHIEGLDGGSNRHTVSLNNNSLAYYDVTLTMVSSYNAG